MSLKKDIQATQSHKVKHCALKSSRECVCIPLTSLLTDSWQHSVLPKANVDRTDPVQNGKTSSLCVEISWHILNKQKYTHKKE